uniref:26S proteasome non-ATPase regulatory subunit 4 n=1 Tax=Panagrolaimus sp. ES5 TaxID=591445 RepID=A0AC34FXM4_9BILA
DFTPTRLQCEQEAAHLVAQCKLRSNPENAVGVLSMADDVKVLSTMTQEDRKIFCRLHEINFEGTIKVIPAIKVAHLALKHRQNRNHKMRIVLFLGSPLEGLEKAEFIKLAKKLKKEKVNVDIVCFGEATGEENEFLQEFIDTLNGKEGTGSNLVVVSSGSTLREALATSPICRAEGGTGAPLVNVNAGGFDFDGEEDPELALALRVSLEEQRARQRQEEASANPTEGNGVDKPATNESSASASATSTASVAQPLSVDPGAMTEEQQLELALRMSLQDAAPTSSTNKDEHATMEVDEPAPGTSGLDNLITDPNALQDMMDDKPDSKKSDNKAEKK